MSYLSNVKLNSRYIPVGGLQNTEGTDWTKEDAAFYYPYVLINLQSFKQHKSKYGIKDNVFLLTDSGGFQVISGTCDYNWEESLKQQLMIGATKIFSFDNPPLIKAVGSANARFNYEEHSESIKLIKNNFEVALLQSEYLKQHAPDKIKDFYYVLHGATIEMLDYNIQLINEKIGMENFKNYFGGVCYSVKGEETFFLTTAVIHANNYFIKKEIPVHVLGFGSFPRIVIMVRCGITTFDSTNAIIGRTQWSWYNNINSYSYGKVITFLQKDYWPFVKPFCDCPVCSTHDLKRLCIDAPNEVGKFMSMHNLYQMVKFNAFLDSIEKSQYTKVVNEFIELNKEIKMSLDYIDYYEKVGIKIAYDVFRVKMKQKPYKTNQKTLGDFK